MENIPNHADSRPKARSQLPKFYNPAEDLYIDILAKRNRRATPTRVTSMITAFISKAIFATTVLRRSHMSGLYARVSGVCVFLSVQSRGS